MANNNYIEKDLGIVTAYGECVAGGYLGSREDFQRLIARMANSYLTYNDLNDKPKINGVELQGNKTTTDLNINTGVTNYSSLSGLPSINGVILNGNKTTEDLNIPSVSSQIKSIQFYGDNISLGVDEEKIVATTRNNAGSDVVFSQYVSLFISGWVYKGTASYSQDRIITIPLGTLAYINGTSNPPSIYVLLKNKTNSALSGASLVMNWYGTKI